MDPVAWPSRLNLSPHRTIMAILQWTIVAAALVMQARGHTLMQNPVPFPSQLKDNGPMKNDASNWPCSGETEFDPNGIMNIWDRGSTQHLQ